MPNVKVSEDTHTRLKWYADTFGTADGVISHLLNKAGMASAKDIRQHKKNFQHSPKLGSEKDAALVGA